MSLPCESKITPGNGPDEGPDGSGAAAKPGVGASARTVASVLADTTGCIDGGFRPKRRAALLQSVVCRTARPH